jgi:GTPase
VAEATEHRAGFVAISGRTNVGKSTLLNRLVGQKVAAVTHRPQTTRRRILGIRSDPDAQFLLIDMPGIHEGRRAINERMVQTARRAISEGEVLLVMIEAGPRLSAEDHTMLAEFRAMNRPTVIAVNKIDLKPRSYVLPMLEEIAREFPEAEIVPISARKGENIDELLATIKKKLPASPSLMSEEEITDQTERMIAEEIIREKIFLKMRQEVPFSTAVVIEQFVEEPERKLKKISALLIVEREAHKGILIGAGGVNLKEIGTAARLELEDLLGSRVFLEMRVRVDRDWTRNPNKFAEYGL